MNTLMPLLCCLLPLLLIVSGAPTVYKKWGKVGYWGGLGGWGGPAAVPGAPPVPAPALYRDLDYAPLGNYFGYYRPGIERFGAVPPDPWTLRYGGYAPFF